MKPKQKLAIKQIVELFKQAELNPVHSKKYVQLARKISKKTKAPIPEEFKRLFCKKCSSFFIMGKNCRVRTANSKMSYTCLNCKNIQRYSYLKEQKARRADARSAKAKHKQTMQ